MLTSWRTSKYNSTILHYRILHSYHGNAYESLPRMIVMREKLCLQNPSSRYFEVSQSMFSLKRDKTKFARSLSFAFFCSSIIAKSSVLLDIILNPNNLLSFLFLVFRSFCCSLFCSLFAALFTLSFFYDRHLYIVLFQGHLFPLNLDDFD